ncbi:hypothetical protein R5R35_014616 [Gryllus longicercus]|uniref:Uncharacterized protein n=1 Tax=Gryllus longicercus TaxID=2509291 RepID=A0AAN9V317_9ORTH
MKGEVWMECNFISC